jgi:hypothetical protein
MDKSSSAGESHPHALTEPDVNLSAHPALIAQPQVEDLSPSERTDMALGVQSAQASVSLVEDGLVTFCISSSPIAPKCDQAHGRSGKVQICSIVHNS